MQSRSRSTQPARNPIEETFTTRRREPGRCSVAGLDAPHSTLSGAREPMAVRPARVRADAGASPCLSPGDRCLLRPRYSSRQRPRRRCVCRPPRFRTRRRSTASGRCADSRARPEVSLPLNAAVVVDLVESLEPAVHDIFLPVPSVTGGDENRRDRRRDRRAGIGGPPVIVVEAYSDHDRLRDLTR
jgi:hypothetical protein